ncbi:MAG: amidohydrolase family protein [Microbacteriaceae bacterium]
MRIDVHSHLCPSELPDFAGRFADERWPAVRHGPDGSSLVRNGAVYRRIDDRYWGLGRRLEYLDRHGIDMQVVSPLPVLLPAWAPREQAAQACDWLNEAVAAFVAQRPDRLVGFGTAALHDPSTIESTLRHVRELGLAGVEIGTIYGGLRLGAEEVRAFFTLAAEWDLPVLVHPLEGAPADPHQPPIDPAIRFSLGVTTDTALAAASLCLSGTLREAPRARVCLSHGGGSYYWTRPRLRQVIEAARGLEAANSAISGDDFWVDTAMVAAGNLRYLADCVDRTRMLIGSDYPATSSLDPLAALAEVGWDDDPAIAHRNASRFLGLNSAA